MNLNKLLIILFLFLTGNVYAATMNFTSSCGTTGIICEDGETVFDFLEGYDSDLLGTVATSAAAITDDTILVGDGGTRGVQDTDWTIGAVGNMVLSKDYAGFLGLFITNSNSDAISIAGPILRLTNDGPYYGSISMASTASTFGSSAFQNAFNFYNQGYGNTIYVVDGAKDHVFYADPTDSHDYSAFTNEIMRLKSDGTLTTTGGRISNVTTVGAATYDVLATDYILNVTYTVTGAVTSLTIPTAQVVAGRILIIKDAGGNSATNNITVDTQGSEKIDGDDTFVLGSDYSSINIYSDGSNLFVY